MMFGLKLPIKKGPLCLQLKSSSKRTSDCEDDLLYFPAKGTAVDCLEPQEQRNYTFLYIALSNTCNST